MIRTLVWRDPATRAAWRATLLALCAAYYASAFWRRDEGKARLGLAAVSLVWMSAAWLVPLSDVRPRRRATELQATLPFSSRTIVGARLISFAVYALVPAIAASVLLGTAVPFGAPAALIALNLGASVLIALYLTQASHPDETHIPAGASQVAGLMGGVAAFATIPGALASSLWPTAALFSLAALFAWRIHRSVPDCLQLSVPSRPLTVADVVADVVPRPHAPPRKATQGNALRGSFAAFLWRRNNWRAVGVAGLIGAACGGFVFRNAGWLALVSGLPAFFVTITLPLRLSWLDPLPVPRWPLVARTTLLPLLAAVAGVLAGAALWRTDAGTFRTPVVLLVFCAVWVTTTVLTLLSMSHTTGSRRIRGAVWLAWVLFAVGVVTFGREGMDEISMTAFAALSAAVPSSPVGAWLVLASFVGIALLVLRAAATRMEL